MSGRILLPTPSGGLETYVLRGAPAPRPAGGAAFNRIAYSAAHVVADPLAAADPWIDCAIDWDATLGYRRHLWSLGLGVAEAMDTAQRGMGLDWATSLELIRRSLDAARDVPGARVASGCGTDHLAPEAARTVDDVIAEAADRAGVPCFSGAPFGHIDDQWTIPLGANAVMDTTDCSLTVTGMG